MIQSRLSAEITASGSEASCKTSIEAAARSKSLPSLSGIGKPSVKLDCPRGNLIIEKNNYKVRDSVILKENKIIKHLKFEKDSLVYLTGGKHIGNKGKVVEIKKYPGISKDILVFKIDNEVHETLADYAYVIEKWM